MTFGGYQESSCCSVYPINICCHSVSGFGSCIIIKLSQQHRGVNRTYYYLYLQQHRGVNKTYYYFYSPSLATNRGVAGGGVRAGRGRR